MINRDINRDMYDYLPKYYHELKEAQAIIDSESIEVEALNNDIKDVLSQFFVDTATWGLSRWEYIVGIRVDESKPIDQRRSQIKSALRGAGTTTVALIKNVAESFQNGEVEVGEDNANYEVIITFVGNRGIPPNMTDVYNAIDKIIPAHIKARYKFTYLAWSELDNANISFNTLDTYRWDDLEVSTL